MRLVTRQAFPFCVTDQPYDSSHVEGEGIHPFRLTQEQAFRWYWRARRWPIFIEASNGVDSSDITYNETFRGYNPEAGRFDVYPNEKRRNCAKYGLLSHGYESEDPAVSVNVDLRFFGPGDPTLLFPAIPAWATLEDNISALPRILRETDELGVETYRPLILWAVHYLVEDTLESFFTNWEALADAFIEEIPGFEIIEEMGSFDGREMLFYGLQADDSAFANSWDFSASIDEFFPFAKMDGSDPICNTATGEPLPGKDPFAHLNPLE